MSALRWLDKPDTPGWWWRYNKLNYGFVPYYFANVDSDYWGNDFLWTKMADPPEPPSLFPKSRDIEIKAMIMGRSSGSSVLCIYLGGSPTEMLCPRHGEIKALQQWCRETYGIEPEVK